MTRFIQIPLLAFVLAIASTAALPGHLKAETLTVAVPELPPGRGNPFTTGSIPGIDIYRAMFDGLAELHESGELRPALATGWEAKDELTWTFTLRQDVKFANGTALTAKTIAANFDILMSPEAQKWSMIRETRNIASVTATSDYTVEVRTKTPDLMLPARFAALLVVEPDYWTEVGSDAFAAAPIGTGPYVVERWRSQGIDLTRNPHAWRSPPTDTLKILTVPESSSRLTALQTDATDIALFMGPEDFPMVEQIGGRIAAYPQGGVIGLSYILVKDTILSDPKIRQALTYAVNRDAITQIIFAGQTQTASQASSRLVFGHNEELQPYPYDPDRARALLTDAGYPDGFSFTADVATPQETDSLVWQQVAADLARVGVTMTVNSMTFARYIQGMYQGTWTGEAFGMNYGALPALDPIIGFQYHSCLWLKPWICDERQTALIQNAQQEFDRDTRRALINELMRVTYEEPIGLYLYERARFDALGPRIANYRAPFGYTSFHDITLRDQ